MRRALLDVLAAIVSARCESTSITEAHWSLVPCQTRTPVPGGVRRYLCRLSGTQTLLVYGEWFWMVWRWASPWSWVAFILRFRKAHCSQWSDHLCGMGPQDVRFYAFLWLLRSLSLIQPADDGQSSVASSVWERASCLEPRVVRYWWSIVGCHLVHMMSKCEQHDEHDLFKYLFQVNQKMLVGTWIKRLLWIFSLNSLLVNSKLFKETQTVGVCN